jgi:hypothetical protein
VLDIGFTVELRNFSFSQNQELVFDAAVKSLMQVKGYTVTFCVKRMLAINALVTKFN